MESKFLTLYLSLIFLNFLNFLTYGLPVTYFPNVAKNKGLYAFEIGLIFSTYPLFSFIFGFVVGKKMKIWGRTTIIKYSQISLGISTIIFGLSYLIPEHFSFMAVAFIARGFQGLSMGAYQTCAYSYVPEYWPEEIDKRIIIIEIFLGFGIGVGPLIGSIFYSTWGYISIFIIPSVIICVVGYIVARFVLPDTKKEILLSESENEEIKERSKESLSFWKVFAKKNIIYIFFGMAFPFTVTTLIMPEFENKVLSLHETPEIASVIYFFQEFGYILFCIYLFFKGVKNRKASYFFSLMLTLSSLWLFGIDSIIKFNEMSVLILMTISFFVLGISLSLCLIPFISEVIEILNKQFPNSDQDSINNMAAGMFNGSLALSEFSGPIIGGILCDLFDFSRCCLFFSVFCLVFCLLFTFHWKGYKSVKRLFWSKNPKKLTPIEIQI